MPVIALKTSRFSISILLSFFFLAACSDDGPKYIDRLSFHMEPEAKASFAASSSVCDMPNKDCPSFSGSMFTYTKTTTSETHYGYEISKTNFYVQFCSTQLIAPNQVLTNRHCLPENLQHEGSNCYGRISFKFPQTKDHAAEELHCSSVLKIAPEYIDTRTGKPSPDWAILELRETAKRPHAKTNTKGVPFDTKLKIFPNFFVPSNTQYEGKSVATATGKIRKVECQSSGANIFSYYYYHPKAPIVFSTCDTQIIGGNSGSGMLNADNELVSLLAYTYGAGTKKFEGKSYTINGHMAGGSNLHCIKPINKEQSPFCKFKDEDKYFSFSFYSAISNAAVKSIPKNWVETKKYNDQVVWEDTPLSFFDQFGDDKVIEEMTHGMHRRYIDHLTHSTSPKFMPKTVLCVKSSASDSFEVDYHMNLPNLETFKVDENGNISFEGTMDTAYRFEFTKNSNDNSQYIMKPARLSSTDADRYKTLKEEVEKLEGKCASVSLFRETYCNELTTKRTELKLWTEGGTVDKVLIKTEEFIDDRPNMPDSFAIPVCRLEQEN